MTDHSPALRQFVIRRKAGDDWVSLPDQTAVEEPLNLRVGGYFKDRHLSETLATVMRTPGFERELAVGFLCSEGLIRRPRDVLDVRLLGTGDNSEVLLELAPEVDFQGWRQARLTAVNSSCGLCGTRLVDSMTESIQPFSDKFRFPVHLLSRLPQRLSEHQSGFAATGGLHAAALVNASGQVGESFEDVGRHNALDKLIGSNFLAGRLPLNDHLVFMSSRSSFELVAKAAIAGAPILATVGGPSSLAIETARRFGMTLVGFVRGERFNVYSGEWRLH